MFSSLLRNVNKVENGIPKSFAIALLFFAPFFTSLVTATFLFKLNASYFKFNVIKTNQVLNGASVLMTMSYTFRPIIHLQLFNEYFFALFK